MSTVPVTQFFLRLRRRPKSCLRTVLLIWKEKKVKVKTSPPNFRPLSRACVRHTFRGEELYVEVESQTKDLLGCVQLWETSKTGRLVCLRSITKSTFIRHVLFLIQNFPSCHLVRNLFDLKSMWTPKRSSVFLCPRFECSLLADVYTETFIRQ